MKMWIEICVDVEWDTSPPQKQTMTDPGFDAELEIRECIYNGLDIYDSLTDDDMSNLDDQAREHETAMGEEGEP